MVVWNSQQNTRFSERWITRSGRVFGSQCERSLCRVGSKLFHLCPTSPSTFDWWQKFLRVTFNRGVFHIHISYHGWPWHHQPVSNQTVNDEKLPTGLWLTKPKETAQQWQEVNTWDYHTLPMLNRFQLASDSGQQIPGVVDQAALLSPKYNN